MKKILKKSESVTLKNKTRRICAFCTCVLVLFKNMTQGDQTLYMYT